MLCPCLGARASVPFAFGRGDANEIAHALFIVEQHGTGGQDQGEADGVSGVCGVVNGSVDQTGRVQERPGESGAGQEAGEQRHEERAGQGVQKGGLALREWSIQIV